MSLSDNIKIFRQKQRLTQEQLASTLGVSPQAVSKWETGASIPDSVLLVDLANALDVSLDALFDNPKVSMSDLSQKIISLLIHASNRERFQLAREITWQIHCGLFYSHKPEAISDPALKREPANPSSFVLEEHGFSVISNGKDPFFSLFPEPEEGFGAFLENREEWQTILTKLSRPHTLDALLYLYQKPEGYVFEAAILTKDCAIPEERMEEVLQDLIELRSITKQELSLNGKQHTLYSYVYNHKPLAILLMANESLNKNRHCQTAYHRTKPLITKQGRV
ncbi:MAG: helix-turn-helix transcriptional regulator [Clostridia bacterium]|nr:helix-turn-helix transcriptional regulator [Clostridia bacterium]